MILDSGILTVFRTVDTAEPGGMPDPSPSVIWRGWYGTRSFGGVRRDPTGHRPDTRIDEKVRILRFREVHAQDLVVLEDVRASVRSPFFVIEDFYHGTDEESGEPVTDLYLRRFDRTVVLP